ncbi:MAG: polyprenyl synthetase family protein, partial [Tepidisphaeraceae bacterium]
MESVIEILQRDARLLEDALRGTLARHASAPPRLIEAIEYSLLGGGKRLRPALVMESCRACGGNVDTVTLAAACAVELVHTFSLVHDDLPAMDDDDLRRGKPTSHKVFGEGMAILAGDAMITLAFEALAIDSEAGLSSALIRELASAAGACGMIGGQVLDIAGESRTLGIDELRRLHRMKTGALLACACRMGALGARATRTQFEAIAQFGQHVGLAFQIVDDLLDVTSTPDQLGKATRKDAGRGKNTFPAQIGVERSRSEAQA